MSRLSVALLGNFEINGAREPFPAGRLRVLLAALALRPERVVVVDELVEQLWGDALPNAPRVTLRGCVKRLRRVLDDGEGTSVIRSVRDGYRIDIAPEQVDVHDFRMLAGKARRAADPAVESGLLDEALSLWRGQPLCDLDSDVLRRELVPVLREEYRQVLHRRIEIGLQRGEHSRFVPQLRRLVARDPLQEPFWAQLLLALHQTGRQAEALHEYQRCRESLVDALGVEPSHPLRTLHQRMLADGAELEVPQELRLPSTARVSREVAGSAGVSDRTRER